VIRPETCYTAECDVCGETLADYESEVRLHFAGEDGARAAARAYRWPVTTSALICDTEDAAHQVAIDALMPAEPMPLNQPTLDGGTA
jgi:hypothetical protein